MEYLDLKNLKKALEDFYNSEKYTSLSSEEQAILKARFEYAIQYIESPREPEEGKYRFSEEHCMREVSDSFSRALANPTKFLEETKDKKENSFVEYIEKVDGKKYDKESTELLYELYYHNDNISVGVHGTKLDSDYDMSPDRNVFFKKVL